MSKEIINIVSVENSNKDGFVEVTWNKADGNDRISQRRFWKVAGTSDQYLFRVRNYEYNFKVVDGKREFMFVEYVGNEKPEVPEIKSEVAKPAEIIKKVEQQKDADGNVKHEKYEQIKTCLECGIPVYLAGPAGSGKNFTVEQIAKELGWNFYFSNSVQQEYKLTGFVDAAGEYHDTEFFKACNDENDCVFFLDEMDASIPDVLVLLNAAIANGYFEFPTGKIDDISNVHFVAAGNTVGSGADDLYTGRMVLDQATLDRFAIIEFGYDKNVEMALSKNNSKLCTFIRGLRAFCEDNGVRATFSYRCITQVTKLEAAGMDVKTILQIAVFKGLDKDTIKTLSSKGTNYDNPYMAAMRELQKAA